jgi:F0F1-type ATP synthase epsilon subunit
LLAESATTVSEVDPNDVTQRIQNAREDVTDAKDAETKADAEAMLSHLELLEKAISMSR